MQDKRYIICGNAPAEVPGWERHFKALEAARKPRRVFVESMGDLFHPGVDEHLVDRLIGRAVALPQHTFMFLTKRPERMRHHMLFLQAAIESGSVPGPWPIPNLWLGVTVCNQAEADEKIPVLLDTPAAVRFVSIEPMLGPIDLSRHLWGRNTPCPRCPQDADCTCGYLPRMDIDGEPRLDWCIVGGESGPGARPMHPDWPLALQKQCVEANVPFFFKQWGAWGPGSSQNKTIVVYNDGTAIDFTEEAIKAEERRTGKEHNTRAPQVMSRLGKSDGDLFHNHHLEGRLWQQFPEAE